MPQKGSQKNAKKQNSYYFRQMIDNIYIFIIKHKKSKLKLLAGGKQGLFNPKLSKKEKKCPKRAFRRMQKNRILILSHRLQMKFIIQHKNSKLKLLAGVNRGYLTQSCQKNEKNAQKGLSEECQEIEFLFFHTDDR